MLIFEVMQNTVTVSKKQFFKNFNLVTRYPNTIQASNAHCKSPNDQTSMIRCHLSFKLISKLPQGLHNNIVSRIRYHEHKTLTNSSSHWCCNLALWWWCQCNRSCKWLRLFWTKSESTLDHSVGSTANDNFMECNNHLNDNEVEQMDINDKIRLFN